MMLNRRIIFYVLYMSDNQSDLAQISLIRK